MPYDDHVRGLLNSRSARTGPLLATYHSPAQTNDTFSMRSPPRESPSLTEWSESPSCYSRSRMSVDDSASEAEDLVTASGYYDERLEDESNLHMSSVLYKHHGSTGTFGQREDSTHRVASYVDPLRDSSEDERVRPQSGASASQSNDTLSDTGAPRPTQSDTSISSSLSRDSVVDPRLSFLGS